MKRCPTHRYLVDPRKRLVKGFIVGGSTRTVPWNCICLKSMLVSRVADRQVVQRPRIEEIDHIEVECSEVWKRREEWSQLGILSEPQRIVIFLMYGRIFCEDDSSSGVCFSSMLRKRCTAGADVEQSGDEGTSDERVFVIPEVINDFVDEFRWDTRLRCASAGF